MEERLSQIARWRAPAFQALLDALLAERSPVYVVGGNVRDFLLGLDESMTDLDLVMEKPVLEAARQVADRCGWAFYPLDRERDVARLVQIEDGVERLECDIAGLRGDLAEDLRSRDFTINSLALALTREEPPRLVDVCMGVDDLRSRRLRPATVSNLDPDPVRLLRAVRFAFKLGLTLEAETQEQIRQRAAAIATVSQERVRDELWKILSLPKPSAAMHLLHELGMLPYVLPELADAIDVAQSSPHHLDVYAHTLLVMDNAALLRDWLQGQSVALEPEILAIMERWQSELRQHFAEEVNSGHSRADWLVWHALFHDVGKPSTRTEEIGDDGAIRYRFFGHEDLSAEMAESRLTTLHFSRREVQLAQAVIAGHMRPHRLHSNFAGSPISRRSAYRFFRSTAGGATGERTGVDVLILCVADRQATGTDRDDDWRDFLGHIHQLLEFGFRPLPGTTQRLLDGKKLQAALHLKPGPVIGHLLDQIGEAQAAGEITSAEEALSFAARLLDGAEPQAIIDEPD
ncbi:MAG: HD domain-containing protein [Caldilineaceae bacterium]|nr:HD domain-containing protein [Caldilineaceae bacterium]